LQTEVARCRSNVLDDGLGGRRGGRIDEHGNLRGCGHQLTQQPEPLCHQFAEKN
jgi:hypothetical protein